MPSIADLIYSGTPAAAARAWPRSTIDRDGWAFAVDQLAAGEWSMTAFWGDSDCVHMALRDGKAGDFGIVSLPCPDRAFPSVGLRHIPARRFERAIRDLWGLTPSGAPDERPWLNHGKWDGHSSSTGDREPANPAPYAFLPAEGESLHEVAVGPVHAGIIEPGHFRFTAAGETVVRLEERLGYVHRGVETLMSGADIETGLILSERISGDSTAAYALAFSRAVEAAQGVSPPPRAQWLRALAVELERVANHLGDFGAVCNDAAFALIHSHAAMLREKVLRASESAFGSRLLRGAIAPGGVRADPAPAALDGLLALAEELERRLAVIFNVYEETSSLQDRTVATGKVSLALVNLFAAGGFVGRASGRNFDARKSFPFAPYDALDFKTPVLIAGDVDARVRIRVLEIHESLRIIRRILASLPSGETRAAEAAQGAAGEGAAIVEGFRGDVFAWLQLSANGRIVRCHMRDPSSLQWPLLEAAIEGNIIADFPLCNKSFNCSYAGHDL